jgi:large subunit ribosomal protein L25
MEAIKIEVAQGKFDSSKEARLKGQIPMIYYAKGIEPKQFTVEYQNFRKAYKKAGKSTIIYLVDEKKEEYPVLVHEIQYHPITDDIIHVDLMAIRKGQKISAKIPLVFVGVAPAVRELAGILVTNKDSVSIECLPTDLPHEIEVDVTKLVDFHTSITVADIIAPKGVTIMDAKNISVAIVSAPRKEEEVVKTAAPVEGAAAAPAEGEKKPEEAAGKKEKE